MGALVQAHNRAKADGGEVRLVITSASVLRIFALVGVDQLLPIFTSLPDALARQGPASSSRRGAGGRLMTGSVPAGTADVLLACSSRSRFDRS